jgi:predicted transcriptional regulator
MSDPLEVFGEYIRSKRIEIKVPLRMLCHAYNLPSDVMSKLERGRAELPDTKLLKQIAEALSIELISEEGIKFVTLTMACVGKKPRKLSEQEIVDKLPFNPNKALIDKVEADHEF